MHRLTDNVIEASGNEDKDGEVRGGDLRNTILHERGLENGDDDEHVAPDTTDH